MRLHTSLGGYYESLPVDYNAQPNKKYPLLIFVHGSGERGDGSQAQLPRVTANGPPKLIKLGKFPTSFTVGGKQFSFIVISPQISSTSGSNAAMGALLSHCLQTYRVDEQRIYITGLSMGGLISYNLVGSKKEAADRFAATLLVCPNAISTDVRSANIANSNLPVWTTNNSGDPAAKVGGAIKLVDMINAQNPPPTPKAKLTIFNANGHDAWSKTYDPAFKEDGLNVYEWMLQYSRGGVTTPPPPVANAGTDQTITLPTSTVTLDGSKSTAPAGSIKTYTWTKVSGPAGGSIATPAAVKTSVTGLTEGTYQFQLKVTDNNGAISIASVKVIVKPAPLPPVADAGIAQTITLPANSVTLSGAKSTAPAGIIKTYEWTKISGPAGSSFSSPLAVTTVVNNLVEGVYVFQLKITDDKGGASTATVTVTVNAAPVPPVAQAGNDQTIELPENKVTVDGSKSTASSGSIKSYEWSKLSGPAGGTIVNPGSAITDITNLEEGVYEFELTVTDNVGQSATAVVTVTVKPAPAPPVANAGADQSITLPQNSVTLDGSASTAEGTIAGYEWTKLSGPDGETIEGAGNVTTVVSGLTKGTYKFQLKVTDGRSNSSTATVTVIVNPGAPPVANAGADTTIELPESSVTLNGAASEAPSGTIKTYSWRKVSGPEAGTFSSQNEAVVTVSNLAEGVYEFELTVTDNADASDIDVVKVTVKSASLPPVADAGEDQTIVLPADSVMLDGSASIASSGVISGYEWTKVAGPTNGTIETPSGMTTMVRNLTGGVYQFELKVTDNTGASGTSTVTVIVKESPGLPVADAGADQTILLPDSDATLNGSASMPFTGTITRYLWTQVAGPSQSVIEDGDKAVALVKNLVEGVYVFELCVTDEAESATTSVTITVTRPSVPPVADAGKDTTIVLPENSVVLNGTASTAASGSISSYNWRLVSGPEQYAIENENSAITAVTGLAEGVYIFELKVVDTNDSTDVATVTVTVTSKTQAPISNAGSDQTIYLPQNSATLDGTASVAPAGTIETWLWKKIEGPEAGDIQDAGQSSTTVSNLTEGTYRFELKIVDNNGDSSSSTVKIIVKAAPVPPVANAGTAQTITLPVDSVTLDGSKSTATAGVVSYKWITLSGASEEKITDSTSAVTVVNNLKKGIYKFQLTVTDSNGMASSATVTVTVKAAPAPPIANAGNAQTIVLPQDSILLDGSGSSSPTGSITQYAWTQLSGPNNGSIKEAGNATTNVSGLVEGVYVFELSVTDDNNYTSSADVTVTVKAPVAPPVANAGSPVTLTLPDSSVKLDGSSSTAGAGISSYSWTKVAGPTAGTITDPNSAVTSVKGLVEGVYEFELWVTDVNGITATATIVVTVKAAPLPPVASAANAAQTITLPDNTATLDGTASAAGSAAISAYTWTKVSGPMAGAIADTSNASTTATGLVEGVYKFELKVTDENGLSSTAVVTVTVKPAPLPPVANAGTAQTITLPESSVTLDGNKSAAGSGSITGYQWTKISGPSEYTITTPENVSTSVTGLVAGVYKFQLEVTDSNGAKATATITVTVKTAPPPPVANAGNDQTITLPVNSVTLTGSKSTAAAGSIQKYEWTKVSGPSGGAIATASAVETNVTGLTEGVYQFQLKVTDNLGVSATSLVTITVKAAPLPPVADAGNAQTITLPQNKGTLDASKSTAPAGEIKSYVWTKSFGPSEVTISNNAAVVTEVTGLVAGTYQFQVKVTDNNNNMATAIVTITVNPAPVRPPVADAGEDFSVQLPLGTVTLDGSASYAVHGTIKSYSWTKVSGPNPLTIVNSNTVKPSVQFTQAGVYVFRLTVTDTNGSVASIEVTVEVIAADVVPEPPVAEAGDEEIVLTLPQKEVLLDGSASTVAVGTIEKYEWRLISGASGVNIEEATSDITNVTGLNMGEYQFELTVTDSKGLTAKDTVKVIVNNAGGRPDLTPTAKIFPNPVQTQATIEVFGQANGRTIVDVYNSNGGKVMRKEFVKNDVYVNEKIDMSSLPKGVYLIEIIIDYQYRTVVKAVKL